MSVKQLIQNFEKTLSPALQQQSRGPFASRVERDHLKNSLDGCENGKVPDEKQDNSERGERSNDNEENNFSGDTKSISPWVGRMQETISTVRNVEKSFMLDRQRVIQGLKERFLEDARIRSSNNGDQFEDGNNTIGCSQVGQQMEDLTHHESRENILSDDIGPKQGISEESENRSPRVSQESKEPLTKSPTPEDLPFNFYQQFVYKMQSRDDFVTIQIDSPKPPNESDYESHAESSYMQSRDDFVNESVCEANAESPFRVSFENIDKLATPLPTRYGDSDHNFSSLIKYCQIGTTTERSETKNNESVPGSPQLMRHWRGCFHYKDLIRRFGKKTMKTTDHLASGFRIFIRSTAMACNQIKHIRRDLLIAFTSMILYMIASLYPTVPRTNFAINCFCLLNYFVEVSQSRLAAKPISQTLYALLSIVTV
jgi:hypothetical protein